MRRYLIINADDLGMTPGINQAVSECADFGMLKSTTLIANGEAFDHAVKMVKERENFGTGIHFTLTGFKPLSPAHRLYDFVGPDGFMPRGLVELLKKINGPKTVMEGIRGELFAQAEKVFDSGVIPTHFDSHKHIHIIPYVLDIIIEIAKRFSVKWMREPFEEGGAWGFWQDIEKSQRHDFLSQFIKARMSLVARPIFRLKIRAAGIQTPGGLFGISSTGLLNEKMIRRICRMLKPGLSELMTHPGIVDADLMRRKSRLLYSRPAERNVLLSSEIKDLLKKHEITLCHFGQINI